MERPRRSIAGVLHVIAHGGMPPVAGEDKFTMFARFADRGVIALGVLQCRLEERKGDHEEIGLEVLKYG